MHFYDTYKEVVRIPRRSYGRLSIIQFLLNKLSVLLRERDKHRREGFFEAVFDFILDSQKPTKNKAVLTQRPTTHSIEKAWALAEKCSIFIGLFLKRDMTIDRAYLS